MRVKSPCVSLFRSSCANMRRKISPILGMILTGFLFLAACKIPVSGDVEKTIYIGSTMVPCEGEASQMCLQVKENPMGEYTYFYDQIVGFDYEEGYEYVIKIREETVDDPPAGASSIRSPGPGLTRACPSSPCTKPASGVLPPAPNGCAARAASGSTCARC